MGESYAESARLPGVEGNFGDRSLEFQNNAEITISRHRLLEYGALPVSLSSGMAVLKKMNAIPRVTSSAIGAEIMT